MNACMEAIIVLETTCSVSPDEVELGQKCSFMTICSRYGRLLRWRLAENENLRRGHCLLVCLLLFPCSGFF
jgi:hypothetical protein